MRKKAAGTLLVLLLLGVFLTPSCKPSYEDTFSIYLADSREIVLTGNDIAAYDEENHSFELNESGIEKWNSYLLDAANPKSRNILFEKDFIISIDGQEICQGRFWPAYSDYFAPEVIKISAVDRLKNEFNKIWLAADKVTQSAVTDYFKKIDKLK